MSMKIAISGKGGTGKTTLAALLAVIYKKTDRVIVIDADPTPNLACAFQLKKQIIPLCAQKGLIEERTSSNGGLFILNPRVDDILEKYGVEVDGNLTLLVVGGVRAAGSGCFCPESAFLKNLIRHLVLKQNEVLILDMDAGIEHLTRGTAEKVDVLIIMVEPTVRAVEVATAINKLAVELGIKKIGAVINKITSRDEAEFVTQKLMERNIQVFGYLSFDRQLQIAELEGASFLTLFEKNTKLFAEALSIKNELEKRLVC